MTLLACLGRANYWFSLPLLAVIAFVGILAIVSPKTTRRLPGRQYSETVTRMLGFGLLIVVAFGATLAVHEARTDPSCTLESSTPSPG